MPHYSEMVYQLGGVPILPNIPFGPNSKVYFVDPANGSAGNDGLTPDKAVASVATAYAKTTSGNNDTVAMIGGATGDTLAETLVWANDYTHLVGISSGLPGLGQRCRITGGATTDLTEVITWSGDGCEVRNVQISNWADADVDSGALTVSGDRNHFFNCMIAGMGHATPAARAGSYSLKLTGSENFFERSSVGLQTVIRAAANAEVVMTGTPSDNKFWMCDFRSYSDTAGKLMFNIDGLQRELQFRECLFFNMSTNWSQDLTNAIDDDVATTHYINFVGPQTFVGITGIADTVTYIFGAGAAPDAGMFLAVNPTT